MRLFAAIILRQAAETAEMPDPKDDDEDIVFRRFLCKLADEIVDNGPAK